MSTFIRVLPRRLAAILAVTASILVASLAPATGALATNVNLRVETPNETFFNGVVDTGPRSVTTLSGNCDGAASSVPVSKPTAVTALADWIDAGGASAPAFATGYGGTYVCRVGQYAEAYPDGSWLLKINNQDSPPPAGFVTAGDQLHEGDSVLVYYSAGNPSGTLDLKIPASAKPNETVAGSVDSWTNFSGDVRTAAPGVTVAGGEASATTGADGKFSISFPASGRFLVTATKSGAVRGSAWITVDPAAVQPPPPPVAVNRFKKCNATHRKGGRNHRRCVRSVRAKQRAECVKPSAERMAVCMKLLARRRGA